MQFITLGQKQPKWYNLLLGAEVMIESFGGNVTSASPGKFTHLYLGLRIKRHDQLVGAALRLLFDSLDFFKDFVRLGKLFFGFVLLTRWGKKPSLRIFVRTVASLGRRSSGYPLISLNRRRTSAALKRVYNRVVRKVGSA